MLTTQLDAKTQEVLQQRQILESQQSADLALSDAISKNARLKAELHASKQVVVGLEEQLRELQQQLLTKDHQVIIITNINLTRSIDIAPKGSNMRLKRLGGCQHEGDAKITE
jgi:hypothetical protein